MYSAGLSLLAIAALTTTALAADLPPVGGEPAPSPYVAPVFDWTGFYVGVQAGYGFGDSTARYRDNGIPGRSTPDPDGWFGGAYAGYNHMLSAGLVTGAEIDAAGGNIKGRGDYIREDNGQPYGAGRYYDTARLKWSGAARLRVGMPIDQFMPYLAGGVAIGGFETHAQDQTPGYVGTWSDTRVGWTVGGGLEAALTQALVLRGEYRFTEYGSRTYQTAIPDGRHRVDLSVQDLRVGLGYKF